MKALFKPISKQLLFPIVLLSVVLLSLNFIDYNINEDKQNIKIHEKFDPSLIRLNSLSKLEQYTDSLASAQKIVPGTLDYALLANEIVSQRFYFKYATQNLNENWIASFAQKITGLFLSSKITADDILTRPYGYCGQVNTVLMELLQRKKLDCRVIYETNHFVIQSYINQKWTYFDASLEPAILPQQRFSEKWLLNKDSLAIAYGKDTQWANKLLGNPINLKFGKINEKQGPHAQIFQSITKVLSKIAFLFPLVCFVSLKRKKLIATKNSQQATRRRHYHIYSDERIGSTV